MLICGSNHSVTVPFYAFLENKGVQVDEKVTKKLKKFVEITTRLVLSKGENFMFIVPITPMEKMDFSPTEKVTAVKDVKENAFSSILDSAIENFKEADKLSDIDGAGLSLGNADDLAQIQINMLKAETMLQTTVQITSRAVNAYKEIMQIQV